LHKDKSSDVGKWLSKFFGLPFLSENEVEDSFAEDIMFDAPDDDNCSKFAYYVCAIICNECPHLLVTDLCFSW
jgi:hypothetical protein